MKNEKGIVHKFKVWNGNTKNIDKLKQKLTKYGYSEEQITDFEAQANNQENGE